MNDEKQNKVKKMIAPIVITVLVVIYYLVYFCVIVSATQKMAAFILLGIIPLALAAVMIYVCLERVKEIQDGEEDDLGKY